MWSMLRTNRDIRSLFIAQVISFAGDWFAYVAFVGLVQKLTDSPLLVTMVYVAQSLPAFLMSTVAGPSADRFDRRTIIRTVSVVQAVHDQHRHVTLQTISWRNRTPGLLRHSDLPTVLVSGARL